MIADFDRFFHTVRIQFPKERFVGAATVVGDVAYFSLYYLENDPLQRLGRIRILLSRMSRYSRQNFLILPRMSQNNEFSAIDAYWAPQGEPIAGASAGYDVARRQYRPLGESPEVANTEFANRRVSLTWPSEQVRDEYLFNLESSLAAGRTKIPAIEYSQALN